MSGLAMGMAFGLLEEAGSFLLYLHIPRPIYNHMVAAVLYYFTKSQVDGFLGNVGCLEQGQLLVSALPGQNTASKRRILSFMRFQRPAAAQFCLMDLGGLQSSLATVVGVLCCGVQQEQT